MSFENLTISRLIVHEVHVGNSNRSIIPPTYGTAIFSLPVEAKDELQIRITNALGKSSHGVEMAIRDVEEESIWRRARDLLLSKAESEFVNISQAIAAKLAASQTSLAIPGGVVVVVNGTCGHPMKQFVCIIKAEPHGGFTKKQANGNLSLEYIRELILTPQAKLYKIGAFLLDDPMFLSHSKPDKGWRAFLFDDLITRGNKLAAAQYFYDKFLGLEFPSNSAFQTKRFHELTKKFVRGCSIAPEKKVELLNALTTYLKTDQTATIRVQTFADSYIESANLRDEYTSHMAQNNFPEMGIHKDLSEVETQLRQRKLSFGHSIKLIAPAEEFESYIRIESIDGTPEENGNVPKWTRITVHDQIRDQE